MKERRKGWREEGREGEVGRKERRKGMEGEREEGRMERKEEGRRNKGKGRLKSRNCKEVRAVERRADECAEADVRRGGQS